MASAAAPRGLMPMSLGGSREGAQASLLSGGTPGLLRLPIYAVALLPLLLLGAASPATALPLRRGSPVVSSNPGPRFAPNLYIVELKGSPLVLGGDANSLAQERSQFLGTLGRKSIKHRVRTSFSGLINGVAIRLDDPDKVASIAAMSDVVNVYPVRVYHTTRRHLPSTSGAAATAASAAAGAAVGSSAGLSEGSNNPEHNMTGVTRVRKELGITGRGVKVGIIDSGIDYTHPAFGACTRIGKDCRVAYGYDFVGDDYNFISPNLTRRIPRPDDDPMNQCDGHGTHVAGTVGGRDSQLLGVAPDVTFGVYRVFGCEGDNGDDVILQAMERAWKDGMDIINLSLGSEGYWAEGDPLTKALDRLSSKGLIVVASIGNSGGAGLWSGGTPGLGNKVVGVASFNSESYISEGFVMATPDGRQVPFTMSPGQVPWLQNGTLAVSSNNTSIPDDACSPFTGTLLQGKIVLIRRGTCVLEAKVLNAQAAGAIAVIMYNNQPEPLRSINRDSLVKIPVAGVFKEAGEGLVSLALSGDVQIAFLLGQQALPNPGAGEVSFFSSLGPSPNLSIKPDLGAPGNLIFSSVPQALGGYASEAGTSMASPYIAGVCALYLSAASRGARKGVASSIKQVLQNSAVPAAFEGTSLLTPVAYQGAGLVNAYRAIQGRTKVTPATLPLGFVTNTAVTIYKLLTVRNTGSAGVTYNITHAAAATMDASTPYDPIVSESAPLAVVSIYPPVVFVPPGLPVPLVVSITLNASQADTDLWIYSGYIRLDDVSVTEPSGDPLAVFVPYQAIKGTPAAFKVLSETEDSSPYLMSNADAESPSPTMYTLPSETATFTFNSTTQDAPLFTYQLLLPARSVAVKLYSFGKNKFMGYIDLQEYVQTYDPITSVMRGPRWVPAVRKAPLKRPTVWTVVPNGEYYATIVAVKGLGGSIPLAQRTETWRSPKIVVAAD